MDDLGATEPSFWLIFGAVVAAAMMDAEAYAYMFRSIGFSPPIFSSVSFGNMRVVSGDPRSVV